MFIICWDGVIFIWEVVLCIFYAFFCLPKNVFFRGLHDTQANYLIWHKTLSDVSKWVSWALHLVTATMLVKHSFSQNFSKQVSTVFTIAAYIQILSSTMLTMHKHQQILYTCTTDVIFLTSTNSISISISINLNLKSWTKQTEYIMLETVTSTAAVAGRRQKCNNVVHTS